MAPPRRKHTGKVPKAFRKMGVGVQLRNALSWSQFFFFFNYFFVEVKTVFQVLFIFRWTHVDVAIVFT